MDTSDAMLHKQWGRGMWSVVVYWCIGGWVGVIDSLRVGLRHVGCCMQAVKKLFTHCWYSIIELVWTQWSGFIWSEIKKHWHQIFLYQGLCEGQEKQIGVLPNQMDVSWFLHKTIARKTFKKFRCVVMVWDPISVLQEETWTSLMSVLRSKLCQYGTSACDICF